MFFDRYDEGDKGWLTIYEAKAFFAHVLSLKFDKSEDRQNFKNIMKLADPEGAKILLKHRVLEFFRMGGFLHLDLLDQEQRKLSESNKDDSDSEDSWNAL